MANFNNAFQPESGINLDDLVGIFAGTLDPSILGEVAPLGSLYIRSNGSLYQKIGSADTAWMVFSQGLGEAVKISATDTTANYLAAKLNVTSSLVRTLQNTGANEAMLLDLANVGTAGTYRSVTTNSKGQVTAGTNPTTLAGYGITDAQGLDATLTALASYATVGFVAMTSADVFAGRTMTGTTNQITVTNGSGSTGNPTFSFPSTLLTFPGTAGFIPPIGTTAQRVNTTGYTRFNSTITALEYYNGTTWVPLVASTGGTVTSVSATAPAAGFTVSGSPITTSGTLTFALANDLAALEGLATTGIAVRTATDTWATRTIVGTSARIAITNGDGVSANPTVDIDSAYVGQSSITTLGTITTGTWAASAVGTAYGGTGRTTIGSANQMLGVNTTGNGLEYKTIANGTGIGLSFTAGQIAINNTGVTSITGTANQVIANVGTGAVTLSLPQSINSTASPTFAQITVAANPTLPLQVATKQYVDAAAQGLDAKVSVRVASTGLLTLSGLQTIDGVSVSAGDRILVKDQGMGPITNGIYIASTGAWTRAEDADTWNELVSAFVFVEEGTSNADTGWLCTVDAGGALGTNFVFWVQFSSAGVLDAGPGLTKANNAIYITDVVTAGGPFNRITYNSRGQVTAGSNVAYLTANQTITLQGDIAGSGTTLITATLPNITTAGTYKSVTVNAKGQVTAGTNPTTLSGFGITDAQPLNAFLTSESALATDGIVIKNGNSALTRSIIAGSTKVSVTNGDGIAGNPSIDVVEANLTHNNIGGTLSVAKGGTNLTAVGTANQVLGVNTGGTALEYKTIVAGTGITITPAAGSITITAASGTVTSVAATGSTGLTVGGSPITTSGTLTFTLATELQGLSLISTTGLVARTAAATYVGRSVVSGNGTITITNPAGLAGNIGIDLTTTGTAGTYRSVTTDSFGRVTAGTNPTTLAGYGITDAVNVSALGANNGVATLDANGKLTTSQLPALAINDTFVVGSQAAMLALSTQIGDMAVRTDVGHTYVQSASDPTQLSSWTQLLDGTTGTVTSVAAAQPAAGLTITGSPITTSGTLTFALADDLAAVEGLSTTGLVVRTAANTWTTRSIVAGTGISITNGDGVAGNTTITSTATGTVTSVALTVPGTIYTVSGSPITSSGTFALALKTQANNAFFMGPASGGPTVPTFRTASLSQGDMSDVVITSPSANQVLAYNSGTAKWVNTGAVGSNAAGLVGVGQAGVAAWTLISGTSYRADFAHNLGTTNVVITVFDSSTLAVILADLVTCTNANTVRVQVTGNTRTLKVVVVANGQSIVAGGSTPSSIVLAKDGVTVGTTTTKLNFTGQAVSVTDAGSNTTNVMIGSRFSYFANSLDNPNNSDWTVNNLAPVITDPTYLSISQRQFSNTAEQGVGFMVSIPPGATQMTVKIRGRGQTSVAGTSVVQPRLYSRRLANSAAPTAWSAATELSNISITNTTNFVYFAQTLALSAFSTALVADNMYLFELTRRVSGTTGTNLAANFLLTEVTVEFS